MNKEMNNYYLRGIEGVCYRVTTGQVIFFSHNKTKQVKITLKIIRNLMIERF